MKEFKDVTIVKKANLYFDGKVNSRTVLFADGTKKTLGLMLPGEYTFGTSSNELMEILGGEMDVLLPGSTEWKTMKEGDSFEVPANASFDLKVNVITDYCCSYF
jgi:purine/pyrimidine-nucleoside phosphorylase